MHPRLPRLRSQSRAELPFGNRLVTIDVLGSTLKAAIENGLSQLPAPSGRFPQVAGLKIEADLSRPAESRVLSIMVGDTPLDANKTYSVATSDFMARGEVALPAASEKHSALRSASAWLMTSS